MALNLGSAVRVIRQLFIDMFGTSAFTINIVEVKGKGAEKYEISIILNLLSTGEETKYIIDYEATQNRIEGIKLNNYPS